MNHVSDYFPILYSSGVNTTCEWIEQSIISFHVLQNYNFHLLSNVFKKHFVQTLWLVMDKPAKRPQIWALNPTLLVYQLSSWQGKNSTSCNVKWFSVSLFFRIWHLCLRVHEQRFCSYRLPFNHWNSVHGCTLLECSCYFHCIDKNIIALPLTVYFCISCV